MRRWWPLGAAIAYVALASVVVGLVPKVPGVEATGGEVVRYYQQHGDGVRVSMWLVALAAIPFVVLVAQLRSLVSGLGRDVMLLGAAGWVIETTVTAWLAAGLALHASSLDNHVARTVADVAAFFGPMLTVSIVLVAGSVGVSAWRGDGGLPRWLAWVSAVVVAEQTIETVTVLGKSGFTAPGGAMNLGLGATLTLAWVVAAGIAASRP
jgi:hypothetical protein